MKIISLPEPELEFAGGMRHIDPRAGILHFGPADANSQAQPKRIPIGLVGDAASLDRLRRWLERCANPIAGKDTHQDRLFPDWPGFRADDAFRAELVFDDRDYRPIPQTALRQLKRLPIAERVPALVDLFLDELSLLAEDGRVKVLLCVRPDEILDTEEEDNDLEDSEGQAESAYDFHDLLKARAMRLGVPIQLVRPRTFAAAPRRARQPAAAGPTLQDEATRAWNIHAAIYYKAGGAPWRLRSRRDQEAACFVGISFFRALDGSSLHTGVAQVFDELGDGVVVRGDEARKSKQDRQVHLSADDASQLLLDALDRYKQYHRHLPARVVLHKSSRFNADEEAGFLDAAAERGIHSTELLWVPRHEDVRLFRLQTHPPLRGTLLSLTDNHHVLYTRGSVPHYATYPGMYVPSPIGLRPVAVDRSGEQVAAELLALTKLNWNNTQFDGREPVTLRIADRVGSILRYLTDDDPVLGRYSFFM